MPVRNVYLSLPTPPRPSRPRYAATLARGALLAPVYWALAHRYGTPGLSLHAACARLGAQLLGRRPRALKPLDLYRLVFAPLESVRYFEFDYAWRAAAGQRVERYLDVSSPRLFPTLFLAERRSLVADLLNPDTADLDETRQLLGALELEPRARLHDRLIADASELGTGFDLITSISVVEHIPDDRAAIAAMWERLRPGGRLVLTVPCAARALQEFSPVNEYKLYREDGEGYVFYQRIYDSALLAERVLSVTGAPAQMEVYGERTAGFYTDHLRPEKLGRAAYPFWREPYMLGREYRRYDSIDELPGWGAVGLTFVKPQPTAATADTPHV